MACHRVSMQKRGPKGTWVIDPLDESKSHPECQSLRSLRYMSLLVLVSRPTMDAALGLDSLRREQILLGASPSLPSENLGPREAALLEHRNQSFQMLGLIKSTLK